jgi:hypothetical protein
LLKIKKNVFYKQSPVAVFAVTGSDHKSQQSGSNHKILDPDYRQAGGPRMGFFLPEQNTAQ